MRALDIIRCKRHGNELSREEIAFLISGYTDGIIPDYQMSAFLMAVNLVGVHRKIGDEVSAGEPLVTLHYNGDDRLEEAVRLAAEACEIQNGKAAPRRLVKTVIGEEEVSS